MSLIKNFEKKPQSLSFAVQRKVVKPIGQTKQARSLSKEFFSQLLKLETQFYNKTYTIDTLNNLTQYYAKAVEYYDNIKDDISSYFIFKIQDILATKKSLTMLSRSNKGTEDKENVPVSAKDSFRSTEKVKPLENDIMEENSESDEDLEEKRGKRRLDSLKDADSIVSLRNQKKRFVNFFYKMEGEIVNQKENMLSTLKQFNELKSQNDQSIQDGLARQKERLREKMEKRKQENFVSRSMNPNNSHHLSFSMNQNNSLRFSYLESYERREKHSSSNLEFMLQELDDLVDTKETVKSETMSDTEVKKKKEVGRKTSESSKGSKETESGESSDNEKISTEKDTDSEKGSVGDN